MAIGAALLWRLKQMPSITLTHNSVLTSQTTVLIEHKNLRKAIQPLTDWISKAASFTEIENFIRSRGGNHHPYEKELVLRIHNHLFEPNTTNTADEFDPSEYVFLLDDYERSFDDTRMIHNILTRFSDADGTICIEADTIEQLRDLPLHFDLTVSDIITNCEFANLSLMDLRMSLHPFTHWLEHSASYDQIKSANSIIDLAALGIDTNALSKRSKSRPSSKTYSVKAHTEALRQYKRSMENVEFWNKNYAATEDTPPISNSGVPFRELF
jgi:hypothetical protein